MSPSIIIIIVGWLVAMAIFFGFVILVRYLQHRERMALITHGLYPPNGLRRQRRSTGLLRAGLIIAMVGLALTAGLYPLGFVLPKLVADTPLHLGPWLLPGLIPLAVGIALIVSYYLEPNVHDLDEVVRGGEKITSLEAHRERERREHSQ